jgi:hypothetical protein
LLRIHRGSADVDAVGAGCPSSLGWSGWGPQPAAPTRLMKPARAAAPQMQAMEAMGAMGRVVWFLMEPGLP